MALDPLTPSPRRMQPNWVRRHEAKLAELQRGPVDVIALGDSILGHLETQDRGRVWQRFYGHRRAVNLGFNGDKTSHLLWRIENGQTDGIAPRLAIVMIGTNNIGPMNVSSVATVAAAIRKVVETLHARLPHTRILLLGIPPNDKGASFDTARREVNAMVRGFDWSLLPVTLLSVDAALEQDGAMDRALFRVPLQGCMLHPNERGNTMLAAAIEPTVVRLLE